MLPIDIAAIERHARELRTQEMRRHHDLFTKQLVVYGRMLGDSLLALLQTVGKILRPAFSWNPQRRRS